MWWFNEVISLKFLVNFLGYFMTTDFNTDIYIEMDFRIVELKNSAQMYEFPTPAIEAANALANNRFPKNFNFGVGSSAYQIEGAFNSSEKGDSVWDYWTHHDVNLVKDQSNGDIACDSFHKYGKDVALVKDLGANMYRISLSWTRILPNGLSNFISHEGIKYYNNLIDNIIANGISPMVTIHHFDIPNKLQLMGGWTSPMMVQYFEDYARVVFDHFGDRVKHWITINDPWELCNVQFGGAFRPAYNDSAFGNYLCGHYALLAHSKVYKMYREQYYRQQRGKVGISLSTRWFEPEDYMSPGDIMATEISFQFSNYWFLNPLVGEHGDYPEIMQTRINIKSALEHFSAPRLLSFSQKEIDLIKGSVDFIGISFFTTYNVRFFSDLETEILSNEYQNLNVSLKNDMSSIWLEYNDPFADLDVKNTADNFAKLLRRLNDDYVLPHIYITANGYADLGGSYDLNRGVYHYDHIRELLKTMQTGINVEGYIAWSLLDGFEWMDGYSKHFGLYEVGLDKEHQRKPKLSTNIIKSIYKSKEIPKFSTISV